MRQQDKNSRQLLSIVELGGYPDFSMLYRQLGYTTEISSSGRKAIAALKKIKPEVIVAEFNFQLEFRDRTSWLESVLATTQQLGNCQVIAFYYDEEREQLEKLLARFPNLITLPRPVDEEQLRACLERLASK